jgi:hypothetical protein
MQRKKSLRVHATRYTFVCHKVVGYGDVVCELWGAFMLINRSSMLGYPILMVECDDIFVVISAEPNVQL